MDSYVTVALPTSDRRRADAFHRALGHDTPGGLAEDGVPEPLRVALNDGAEVMYVPSGGFGWVTEGRRPVADRGTYACLVADPDGHLWQVAAPPG